MKSKQMKNGAFNNEVGKLFESNEKQIICSIQITRKNVRFY